MRSSASVLSVLHLLTAVPLLGACLGSPEASGVSLSCSATGPQGTTYSPCRAFHGRLQLPPPADLVLPARPLQVTAVGFVADPAAGGTGSDAGSKTDSGSATKPRSQVKPVDFYGPLFVQNAGAGQQAAIPFAIVVPCGLTVNLVLQIPRTSSDESPGFMVAAMSFARDSAGTLSTLVPAQGSDTCAGKAATLDLGTVVLEVTKKGDFSTAKIVLGKGNSKNPLSLIDSDGDGTADLSDTDDDDDGESDSTDQDAEGDGILDTAQTLEAFDDVGPKDGIPDRFQ